MMGLWQQSGRRLGQLGAVAVVADRGHSQVPSLVWALYPGKQRCAARIGHSPRHEFADDAGTWNS
jgi:hypothetical protein